MHGKVMRKWLGERIIREEIHVPNAKMDFKDAFKVFTH